MPTTRISIPVTPAAGDGVPADVPTVAGNALNHRLANRVGGRVLLFVHNGAGAPMTVTLHSVTQSVHADDISQIVGAGKLEVFGPLPAALFTQPSGTEIDEVQVDLSDPTTVTLFAICF